MKKRLCFGKRLYCSIVALSLFVMCSNNLFAVNKSSSENTSTVHDFQQSAGEDALDFIFISDDENGILDYRQKTITYYQGMIEGDPKTQVVAIDSPVIVTDMGFKFNRLVLLGWHTTKVKPLFVTTLAAENDLILSGDFYGIGDTLITSVDMPLYAVWAMDMNNDGYPDYPGSGIIKPKSRSMELRDGESTGSEEIVGVRVWSYDNTLYIDSDKSVRVNIYTLGGMLFKQLEMAEGLTSEVMQRGMYIVEIDGLRYKVIVK